MTADSSLDAVFAPRRVAVVGASNRSGKMGTTFMRNLAAFPGEVIPVTMSQETVGGSKSYRSLRDVPGQVDLAVVVVPAEAVPGVMADAAAARVRAAIVISGGFAESGPAGAALQAAALDAARAGGVRLVGPNCFGVQNCNTGLNASMATGSPPSGGDIALATQSGAYGMAIYTLGRDQDLRFSKVYAAGNKADIGDAEVLTYLGADVQTAVLCFFLESLGDGRAFFECAREITPHKPVLVAKTGRSEAGARAAVSHTAALAGDARVFQAAFRQAGVVVARSGLEMMDAAKALDWQPVPAGPRVGIVTNSGGVGVELTDLLSEEGLVVPELSPGLQARLAKALPAHASPRNPVDMTPSWARFAALYPHCLETLARSGEVDAVALVLLQRSALDPEVAQAVIGTAQKLTEDGSRIPVYICWVAPHTAQPNADLLQAARLPCFEWPERTARALGHAIRYGQSRAKVSPGAHAGTRPARLPPLATGLAPPDTAASLVRAFGVEVAPSILCDGADEAVAAAAQLGYPVVVKIHSQSLVHKSDAGGVRLGLPDEAAVRDATRDLHRLDRGARVLVQPQLAGQEVIIGGIRDPQLGPMVMAGLGGVFVETLGDVAFRVAPIDQEEAAEALRSLRGYPMLTGARGRPRVDIGALAATLSAVSRLMVAVPEIAELDLNPVLATPHGATAVDVRIRGVTSGP